MTYWLFGLILFILGCFHLIGLVQTTEKKISRVMQSHFNKKPWINLFQEIWFMGRTIFVVVVICFLILWDWKTGFVAGAVFLVTAGIEQLIKKAFNRSRPFSTDPSIQMAQPQQPSDPSFPSGDTLRIWYLAMILSYLSGNSISLLLGLIFLALLVSIGRIIMGVHYLTDILAGAGLGLLGSGTTILLWQFFNHI